MKFVVIRCCFTGNFASLVCHKSSNETRWNRLVVVVHLYTFDITVEATIIIEMNKSIKQIQRARVDDMQNHIYFHDLPTGRIYLKLCHTLRRQRSIYPFGMDYSNW